MDSSSKDGKNISSLCRKVLFELFTNNKTFLNKEFILVFKIIKFQTFGKAKTQLKN